MNDKSGIALGVGTPAYKGDTMYAVDEVSIGKIEVNANTFAGIIHGDNSNKDTILKLNTVDINSGTLDLGAKNKINATFTYGYKAPTIQSANSDGSINVNFNNDTSSLVLGNIGSKDTKNPVSLNLNFNNAALTGNDNSVSFGKDVTIADGSSINAIAVDGFIKGMNAEQTAQKLADKVFDASTDQNKNAVAQLTNTKAHIAAAGINEGYSYDVDKNTGEIITSSVAVTENTATHSLSQLNAISYMQWRSAMNHLQYRMGELRDHKGLNNGVWLRVYNGKDKYGSQNQGKRI